MAILNGINTKLRGSIGQYTFQRLNGQTVAKEKVEKKAIPVRTLTQMLRRVRWANLVNMYRAFEGTLHPSFESKDPRVSDYNMFMQATMLQSPRMRLCRVLALSLPIKSPADSCLASWFRLTPLTPSPPTFL